MQTLDDLDTRLLVDLLRDRSHPRKSLGQHFLIDDGAIERTIELAVESGCRLSEDSHVLEIGPGPGSLTLALLRSGARITALEVDPESVSHLKRIFGGTECGIEVREVDAVSAAWPTGITHVISNLPFQISSPVLERIRAHHSKEALELVILLVQDEFAARMAMSTAPYDMGPLGLNLWLDFEVTLDRRISPSSFSPSPLVHSRLVTLRPEFRPELKGVDRALFKITTKHCFAHRRRKLRTLLSEPPRRLSRARGWHKERWGAAVAELGESENERLPSGWLDMRPGDLEVLDWVALVRLLSSK